MLAFGRTRRGWGSDYRSLQQLPREWPVALNGTFFSWTWHEPAGPLLYDRGQQLWTPRFRRPYAGRQLEVYRLARWFLAVSPTGRATLGNSRGRTAGRLARELHPACLLGGGGPLLRAGRSCVSADDLAAAGFDERSGLQPDAAVPRSGVGIDATGQLWLVTAGLEGGGLSVARFARLMLHLGARDAMFLDCGSSSALRVGAWQRSGGRALPTWLVARPLPTHPTTGNRVNP